MERTNTAILTNPFNYFLPESMVIIIFNYLDEKGINVARLVNKTFKLWAGGIKVFQISFPKEKTIYPLTFNEYLFLRKESGFFAKIFDLPFQEKFERKVEIEDIKISEFKEIILNKRCLVDSDNFSDALHFSSYLEMPCLEIKSADYFKSLFATDTVSFEEVKEVFDFAEEAEFSHVIRECESHFSRMLKKAIAKGRLVEILEITALPIKQLDLTSCDELTDEELVYLEKMPLQSLSLNRCKVTNEGLAHLKGLPLQSLQSDK
jgi:hypothetical protein